MTPGNSKKGRRTSSAPPILSKNKNSDDDEDDATEESSINYSTSSSIGKRKSSRKRAIATVKKVKYEDDSIKKSSITYAASSSFITTEESNNENTPIKKNKKNVDFSPIAAEFTSNSNHSLILVSDKRRGVYECDYCRRDISQVPRIRCAVCPDFDSCLECFPTAMPPASTSDDEDEATDKPKRKHDVTHGYRVADSTRYPLFPSDNAATLSYKGNDDKLWTIEEDLRLLEGISTLGLGNWIDISDVVGKNPKRCMERYFDDFLGRYGHILPRYTWLECEDVENEDVEEDKEDASVASNSTSWSASSKRKKAKRSTSCSDSGSKPRKYTRIETDTIPGYNTLWADPFLPEGVSIGEDVNRDVQYRAEQSYVKSLSNTTSKCEADKLIQDIKSNSSTIPTVFPPRIEDIRSLPGSELAGYMPRRGDFDVEWDNDAESILADMEFSPNDHPNERQLKIEILQIYNSKLDERERRKKFIQERNLLNYRQRQLDERNGVFSRDEKDLLHRMRLFARFHSPQEHDEFCKQILEAKRLRKEIAQLQLYYSLGFTSLSQVEQYENDKNSREFHKNQVSKSKEKGKAKPTLLKSLSTISNNDEKLSSDMEEYNLLKPEEIKLCSSIDILPKVYLQVKRVLIENSLEVVKDEENNAINDKVFMQLDVEKRGQVVDFVFRAGWIPNKPTFIDG